MILQNAFQLLILAMFYYKLVNCKPIPVPHKMEIPVQIEW